MDLIAFRIFILLLALSYLSYTWNLSILAIFMDSHLLASLILHSSLFALTLD